MATGTFLDGLNEWNAKSAVVIKDLALGGDFETASLLSSLRTTANDESLTEEVRLNALTALINRGELLDIPVPPYYPVAFSFTPTQTYVGLHNDLSGLNTGDYWHLTYAQYLSVLNKANISDITFGNLTGSVDDSIPLSNALDLKQDAIPAGSTGQFFGWDGIMRFVSWTNLINKPTTLAGLGISSSDTLFDGRYLSQSSILTSYTLGSNTAVLNTDSLVGAIGKLQAQVNSVSSSTGTINSVGLTMDNTVFSVSPATITGSGGTFNVTFQSKAAKTFFAAPNAGSGTPSFRQIVVEDLPTSGVTAGNYGNTTNWPTFTVDSYGRITSITTQAATSGGTVTSVALSAPVEFEVSGSPVIDDGTLGLSWASGTPNYVFAGPSTNVEEVPSFRPLVPADIPALPISQMPLLQGLLDDKMTDSLGVNLIFMGNASLKAAQTSVGGDLTASFSNSTGTNVATFTIANQAVTYGKFQNIPGDVGNTTRPILLGRFDATEGPMQQLTLSSADFETSALGVIGLKYPNPPSLQYVGDLLTSTGDNDLVALSVGAEGSLLMPYAGASSPACGLIWGNVGGDISYTINADATPYGEFLIGNGKVTLDKMADADAYSIIGNDGNSAATPVYLTKAQATTLINSFDPTSNLPGLVPNGSGNSNTVFLSGAGTWLPAGTGSGTVDSGTVGKLAIYTATTTVDSLASTNGSIFYTNSSGNVVPLAAGTDGKYLKLVGGYPSWEDATGGNPGGSANQLQYNNGGTTFGGIVDMEYSSGTGVYATASKFFLTNSAATQNFSINFSVSALGGDYTWAFPDAGSTFVGTDVSQELTNKTLSTGSKINLGTAALGDMWYSNGGAGTIAVIAGDVTNDGKYLKYTTSGPQWSGVTVTSTANISGGTANQILYQTNPGVTDFIVAPSSSDTFLKWTGSAFTWAGAGSGSGTVSNSTNGNVLAIYSAPGTTVSPLAAITASRALVSNANGLPVASSVSTTQLQYLASATGTTGTTTTSLVFSESPALTTPNIGAATGTSLDVTGVLTSGTAGNIAGAIVFRNGTNSFTQTIRGTNYGSNIVYNWPSGVPTAGQVMSASAPSGGGEITLSWASVLTNPMTTAGDIIVGGASGAAQRLGIGSNGTVLTSNGSLASWQPASATLVVGTSAITSGTAGRILFQSSTNVLQQSANLYWDNTNSRLSLGAGSSPSALLQIASGTASVPQIILTPTTATPAGTTAGSLWYYEFGGSEYLAIYKTTAALQTKIITKDTNPDFSTGASGVLVSNNTGTLTKSADLTALGILATYSTYTVTTSATNIFSTVSYAGSTGLSANFFATGKTIVVFVSGQYTTGPGTSTLPLTLAIGGYSQLFTVTLHASTSNTYWEAKFVITCSATGTSGTLRTMGSAIANSISGAGTPDLTQLTLTSVSINTTIANTISLNANYTGGTTAATIDMCQIYYLN